MVRAVFLEHCSGVMDDVPLGRHRGCLVDEHYYHTLIAVRQSLLDGERIVPMRREEQAQWLDESVT